MSLTLSYDIEKICFFGNVGKILNFASFNMFFSQILAQSQEKQVEIQFAWAIF